MLPIPADIFTEPDVVPDDLANLGPLRRLAGVWQADKGVDINPKAEGPERRVFREHIRMDPIDPQTNGPQLLYGLRYHIHINTPEEEHHLSRPGRLLAVGAGDRPDPAERDDSAGPGRCSRPASRSRTTRRSPSRRSAAIRGTASARLNSWTRPSARRATAATSSSTRTEAGPTTSKPSCWSKAATSRSIITTRTP